ncbi:MAG: hypothetical protein GY832_16995 [Chloroflexi bacterium]|nr:hypothetical protein [Chloroflexota bacterium]
MMTEQEAKRYVAAQLAYLALDHQRAAEECPNLAENTESAIRNLRDAAVVLGLQDEFEMSCVFLGATVPVR